MTALAPHRDAPIRRRDRVPWSPRAWSQVLYLTGAIPVLAVVPLLMVAGGLATKPRWALPLLVLVVALLAVPLLTRIHCRRLRATAGIAIRPQPMMPNGLSVASIREAIRSPVTWRQLGYHFLAAPVLAAAAAAAFMTWLAGFLYALVYTYAWTLPAHALLTRGQSEGPPGHLAPISNIPVDVYLTVGGLALLAAAPWLTAGVAALDVRITQAMLGPSRAEALEHRVERLTQTRAGVVDAADAERRRLERNLHDGTQQRLVSLAMNLGMDAALSGVAARMPIPVRLTVNVPRRPPPTIEAVAYFVVSEGLTNITKHSQASQAEVFVQRDGDRLHIIVTDDGVGGADPARGTGLAGLARRAESVDGALDIASPPGGPTLLTVDLPCAR
jgi:signal transduction histidine kinase